MSLLFYGVVCVYIVDAVRSRLLADLQSLHELIRELSGLQPSVACLYAVSAQCVKLTTRSTCIMNYILGQPCILPGSLNENQLQLGVKASCNVTSASAGWQVTLCDPMWHVSSSSGVATSVSELL